NAFRVARSAAVEAIAVDAAGEERRDAVDVGGEDEERIVGPYDHVEPVRIDRLFGDDESDAAQVIGEPARRVAFAACRRIDVDEGTRQRDNIDRHARHTAILATTINAEHAEQDLISVLGGLCVDRKTITGS